MEIALELMHFEMRFRKLYSGRGIMLKLLLAFEVDRIFGTSVCIDVGYYTSHSRDCLIKFLSLISLHGSRDYRETRETIQK